MIKTIDTSQITEEMFKAFRLGDDLSGKIFNLLEAAPEVKTRPIGTLFLGGIEGNEYGEIDVDLKSKALEALQEELVSSENPVVLEVYAHPPAVSEGWIRAIDEALVCHHIDVANATDTYEQAKDKLNKLLCVVQDIGAYFAKQEQAQKCHKCGHDWHADSCVNVAPKQEPAQAVPAFWANENILKDSLRDNISCILTTTKCAANTVPLYTAPPAIDDETKRMVLDLCRLIIDKAGPDSMITRAMAQKAEKISERLEAGE